MLSLNWQQTSAYVKLAKDRIKSLYRKDATQKTQIIGLDIGAESIKLLEIDRSAFPFHIRHFAMTPLPPGAIIKGEIKDAATISNTLSELMRQNDIQTKNIAIAIPRSVAIIKNILISNQLTSEEIETRAWIEAGRHFTDLVSDIYLDYCITNKAIIGRRIDDPLQQELMLIACRKEHINPYLSIIENANLIPKIVDVNCYALERALGLIPESTPAYETVALLNLNTTLSSLVVVHQGKMIHAHDETFDGQHLMSQISEYLREKELHDGDTTQNLDLDETYNAILRNNLISHLRHIVQFIYSSHPDLNIKQIVLSGDCASIPTLASFTEREISTPSIIANPFTNMIVDKNVDKIELYGNAQGLMLSAGLALSNTTLGEETL